MKLIALATLVLGSLPASAAQVKSYTDEMKAVAADVKTGTAQFELVSDILTRLGKHVDVPLRIYSTGTDALVRVGSSLPSAGDGAGKILGPVGASITDDFAETTVSMLTGTVSPLGNILTDGGLFTLPTSPGCPGTPPCFRNMVLVLRSDGKVDTHFSPAAASVAALEDQGTTFSSLSGRLLGYVTLQAVTTTTYKTAGSSSSIVEMSVSGTPRIVRVQGTPEIPTTIVNGGTGQRTANDALNAFLPSQTGNASKGLVTDGSNSSWQTVASVPAAGSVYSDGLILNSTTWTANANKVLGVNSGASGQEFKSILTGTTGTDFAVAHAAGSITLNLPDAGAAARGLVTTGPQTFGGSKTFGGTTTLSTASVTTLNVSGTTTLSALNSAGLVHTNGSGVLSTSLLVNADVAGGAGIAFSKLASLANGQALLGNGGVATATTLSGDVTVNSTGVMTIAANAVGTAEIANGTVSGADLATTISNDHTFSGAITLGPDGGNVPHGCSILTAFAVSTSVTVTCSGADIAVGGGPANSTNTILGSRPVGSDGDVPHAWICSWDGSAGQTCYAVCCDY